MNVAKASGKTPVASDSLKRIDKGKAISSATILRAAGGISSGPAALDGSRSFSSCRTSREETGENSHSECLVAGPPGNSLERPG